MLLCVSMAQVLNHSAEGLWCVMQVCSLRRGSAYLQVSLSRVFAGVYACDREAKVKGNWVCRSQDKLLDLPNLTSRGWRGGSVGL